ncbi:hypothetical protein [Streptomyces sp. Ac-502]|uniref:hypothetical protein n=1 Tax=Streptomyces sp. Ac-502 TaxID=3342801 RepID=UPI003862B3DD
MSYPPGLQVGYPLRACLKYLMRHISAEHGKHAGIAFTVPVQHCRGCGPEAARRIARADGWQIIKPGRSVGNHVAPEDRQGLTLAVPDPRLQPVPSTGTPSERL